jgi:hypothetical protein
MKRKELGEIGARLGEIAAAVKPAQFLQVVVVGLTHLFIASVEDEVGERLVKRAASECLEAFVQPLVDGRDGGG